MCYAIKNKIVTVEKIANSIKVRTEVVLNSIRRLREKGLLECYEAYVLRQFLSPEEENRIRELVGPLSGRRLICYPTIDEEAFVNTYLKPLNLTIDDILKYEAAKIIGRDKIERLKKLLGEYKED